MGQSSATNPIVARIDEAAAAKKMSRQAIAKAAGFDRGYLQKLEQRGPRASVRAANLMKLADAAGIPRDELLALAPKEPEFAAPAPMLPAMTASVPIRGIAAGSALGAFVISDSPIGHVARPPALEQIPDAYAVYVDNDSMTPLHNPGDLRFVHPHRPARPGDSVILQVSDADGDVEAYIKIFERRSADWVIARQLNPAAEVKFKRERVLRMHRVLTINELFNA